MGIDADLLDESTSPTSNGEDGHGYGGGGDRRSPGEMDRRSPEKRQAACEEGFGPQDHVRGFDEPRDDEDGSASPFAATQYPILQMGETQTRTEAALNLLNNLLGAGLLAMPKAFSHTGIITGLGLMVAVGLANRYTLLMLLDLSQSQLEECSFPEIGRHVFGQKGLLAVLVAYLLFTGGILSAYLIAITDILQQLPVFGMLPRFFLVLTAVGICTPGAMLKSLRKVAVVSGICMLGVCILVVTLTAVSVWDALTMEFNEEMADDPGRPGVVHWFLPDFGGLLDGAALFALQFSVQAGGIEVLSCIAAEGCERAGGVRPGARDPASDVEDMEDQQQQEEGKAANGSEKRGKPAPDLMNADLASGGEEAQAVDAGAGGGAGAAIAAAVQAVEAGPGAKSMTELMRAPLRAAPPQPLSDGSLPGTGQAAAEVSTAAFIAAAAFMAVIGVAGYMRFGDRVRGDVLLSFGARVGGDSSPALAVARLAYGIVVTCSFAFVVVPCRFAALDVFALRRRDSTHASSLPPDMHKKVTGVILAACASIALVVSDLAMMLEFVGVWSTMALSFVLPCSFLVELRRRQEGTRVLSRENALPLFLIAFGVVVAAMGTVHILGEVFGGSSPEVAMEPMPEATAAPAWAVSAGASAPPAAWPGLTYVPILP